MTRNLAFNLSAVKVVLLFIEKPEIKSKNYIDFINTIAAQAGINPEMQEYSILKTTKKGRKKKFENME